VNEAMQGHDKQIRITDIMELVAELVTGNEGEKVGG
jgi:hypothetical protein